MTGSHNSSSSDLDDVKNISLVEVGKGTKENSNYPISNLDRNDIEAHHHKNKLKSWYEKYGIEERGIERYPNDERKKGALRSFLDVLAIWVSVTGGLTSMSSFFLGPVTFGLSLKNSLISGILGCCVGSLLAAYCATMGPRSGLRQLTNARFLFGWWFIKFIALISVVGNLGWAVVSSVFGGQILAALSDGKVPIEIGILIIAIVSVILAVFGIKQLVKFEAWLSIPILIAFLLLYISSGSMITSDKAVNFQPTSESHITIVGNSISFFALSYSVTATWGCCASDYYIFMSSQTNRWSTYWITFLGICLPTLFVAVIGIYLSNCASAYSEWHTEYDTYGLGGILLSAFKPWKGGGKFLLVILYFSLITNNALNTYSMAFMVQVFSHLFLKVPRFGWSILIAIIYFVISVVGKDHLSTLIGNFVPMLGYWITIYITLLFEENLIFRNKRFFPILSDREENSGEYMDGETYEWKNWNHKPSLTNGYAAIVAFAVGAVGAVLGMAQVYYVGVIGRLVGDFGADLGLFLCCGFSGIVYPFLRFIELKKYKK